MSFDEKKGWTLKPLGPTRNYWKRKPREVKTKAAYEGMSQLEVKRKGLIPLQDLDPYICELKHRKGSKKHNQNSDNGKTDGDVVVAMEQHRKPNECDSLELLGIAVIPSGSDTH